MSSLVPQGDRNMRVGDAERSALSELLRTSVDRGYLTLDEYEKRVGVLMEAKTVGDVEEVLRDLPAYQAILDAEELEPLGTPDWIKWMWFGMSIPILINLGIWAILWVTVGPVYFWPVWVMLPILVAGGAVTFAERQIIRPEEEKKRRKRRKRS